MIKLYISLKTQQQNSSKTVPNEMKIPKETQISLEERQETIDDLRFI